MTRFIMINVIISQLMFLSYCDHSLHIFSNTRCAYFFSYKWECPVDGCIWKGAQMSRHLMSKKHGWEEGTASLTQSFRTRMFNYLTKIDKVSLIIFVFFYPMLSSHSLLLLFSHPNNTILTLNSHVETGLNNFI